MSLIFQNFSLHELNTFHLPASARYFAKITSTNDMDQLVNHEAFKQPNKLVLGGGSNLLFTKDFDGLVIHSEIEGIQITSESENSILVRVGSGVEWDEFVAWSVANQYGGVENLSAIPGCVGASPVQNIGAYGVEAKDVIEKVEGFDFASRSWKTFSNADCQFEYRNSLFKKAYRNNFLVSYVAYRLQKTPHTLVTHYGNIEEELGKSKNPGIAELRRIICEIREAKLPDVEKIGNAGSFFKNPIVPKLLADELKANNPGMPQYPAGEAYSKLSAAWLIDQSGLKGFSMGNAATHIHQPLVLINKGGASGAEIWQLAKHIQSTVKNRFGVLLEPEVNVY